MQWTDGHMVQWLRWAIPEFSLEGFNINQFAMQGSKLCRMSEEEFLSRTPPFMGDILWAHLEILRRGMSIKKAKYPIKDDQPRLRLLNFVL